MNTLPRQLFRSLLIIFCLSLVLPDAALANDARNIVKEAIEYWRGASSITLAKMTVHRPEWERSSTLKAWMRGNKKTLVRFLAPPKNAGNASLTLQGEMWTFVPNINRIVKIPGSMMGQSWMGSDFSYKDLSKSDALLDDYKLRLLSKESEENHTVYVIEAIPNESAPVVWGKEVLRIRDDHIILSHEFFDQDMVLTKRLITKKIGFLGGRMYSILIRMEQVEKKESWTEIEHLEAKFNPDIPLYIFTLSNLRNPR